MAATFSLGRGVSRRTLLTGGAGAGLAMALSACAPPEEGVDSNLIRLPDPASPIPTEATTFRVIDSGDTKAPYWRELLGEYRAKHDTVETSYDGLPWGEINELVPLSVRNQTLHDLVQLLPGPLHTQAIQEGWVAPLDDVMPNFAEWKAQYPENILFEGIHIFDGKTYCFPATADKRYEVCLLYSKSLMNEAGYDPESTPLSWDDYRDAARKITAKGNGQRYGVVLEGGQPGRLDFWITSLAQQLGGYGTNPLTGEFDYTSDAWVNSFELLQALMADGSIFPGSTSLTAPQAWPRVVTESAGMVTAGPWVITQWEKENPEFQFGVAAHPRPGPDALPITYAPGKMSDAMFVYAGSTNVEIAGDVLAYHGSLAAAQAWGRIVGPGSPPVYPQAVETLAGETSPAGQRSIALAQEIVMAPSAVVRNPDVAKANLEMDDLTPDLGDVVAGVLDGSVTDVRGALQSLSDRSNRQRDDAIAAAVGTGAAVSREDYVFPNFVPGQDYTQEMYDAI